ncbi:MAG: type I DNA topoisomerase, partial [bacterium]|nr:type I DNA topoisomerase [bacterium]
MNLVIVESPAKAKTIEKYLGSDFKVMASYGHVRDLPQKSLGIDLKKNYEPEYEILSKAKKTVSTLKAIAAKSDQIYLATDLDREGEAISWHLAAALNLAKSDKTKRIVFNEITKSAVERAVKNPRSIDIKLVDAQQARRVLDRLVGYKLSPLLWKKVKKGLSAGRVQSVAVRLVVEKEREIEKFKPVEYWILGVKLSQKENKLVFPAYLTEIDGKSVTKYDIKTKPQANQISADLDGTDYTVLEVKHDDLIRTPAAPFTTSTLQMEASRKLGFSPKQTMMLAQQLYESGHITYMRTDSINLSSEAVSAIKKTVLKNYGEKYLSSGRLYTTKTKHAQEAHEAIRPTHFDKLEVSDDRRGQKLYDLIWKRTVATQMSDAILDILTVRISAKEKKYVFRASGEAIKFDGFIKVYQEGQDDEAETQVVKIPELKKDELLKFIDKIEDQKFTEPPKRYSEATLVKKLEGLGIGRPSTYAPTLET